MLGNHDYRAYLLHRNIDMSREIHAAEWQAALEAQQVTSLPNMKKTILAYVTGH